MVKEGRVTDFPVSFRTKDNRKLRLNFTGTVMKDNSGVVIGFLGTVKPQELWLNLNTIFTRRKK